MKNLIPDVLARAQIYISGAWRLLNNGLIIYILCFIAGFTAYLFLKRVINPDVAFDTINYHFLIGKLGYENFPHAFKPVEFFPLGFHSFNPIVDMLSYATYKMLGYRLGTLLSFLSLLGIYVLIYRILRKTAGPDIAFVAKLFLLPALVVNEAFFQVGTYFTDNIYAFFIVLYLSLSLGLYAIKSSSALLASLVLLGIIGGVILTKLTNAIYYIPLLIVTIHAVFVATRGINNYSGMRRSLVLFIVAAVTYSIPVILITSYHFSFVYHQTGNPVFPFYNAIFQSPYYNLTSWKFNFGPVTLYEKIFYPYYVFINPVLLGEVKDLFPDLKLITGALSLVSILCFLKLLKVKFSLQEKVVFFVTIASYCLWQVMFGYSRYGIALEYYIGASLVIAVNKAVLQWRMDQRMKQMTMFVSFILLVLFASQTKKIMKFNDVYDIAWRPPASYADWKREFLSASIFNKYTTVPPGISRELENVDVIVQCVNPSSAYSATIPELMTKPMMNFDKGSNGGITNKDKYVETRDGRIIKYLDLNDGDEINFAIVLNDTNKGLNSREVCLNAISIEKENGRNLTINKEFVIDNFVGDKKQILTVFLGSYNPVKQ